MKILIIEDTASVVETISVALELTWPEAKIVSASSGNKGIDMVQTESPDVIILDLGLPDINGFDVIKQVRLFSRVPILVLTARIEEPDVIKALSMGADEYVTKPFKQLELVARVKALVRRSNPQSESPLICGVLHFDPTSFKATKGKKEVNLTRTEGLILGCLMRNCGNVVPNDSLTEAVWGENYPDATDNLKVYIRYLRQKIEDDPGNPQFILNRPGIGYYIAKL
jgi:two-component system KDP operon response regulator KdpE